MEGLVFASELKSRSLDLLRLLALEIKGAEVRTIGNLSASSRFPSIWMWMWPLSVASSWQVHRGKECPIAAVATLLGSYREKPRALRSRRTAIEKCTNRLINPCSRTPRRGLSFEFLCLVIFVYVVLCSLMQNSNL